MTKTTPAPAEAPDVAAALNMLLADAAVRHTRRRRANATTRNLNDRDAAAADTSTHRTSPSSPHQAIS